MAIAVPSLLVHRGCITAVARTFCPAVIMVDPPGTRQRRLRPTPGRCAAPSRIDGPLELQDFTEAPFVVLVDTGIRRGMVVYRRLDERYDLTGSGDRAVTVLGPASRVRELGLLDPRPPRFAAHGLAAVRPYGGGTDVSDFSGSHHTVMAARRLPGRSR
jgi:hypothetical protein